MLMIAFFLFLVFLFLGVPIAFSLGCGSIIAILIEGIVSPMLVAQKLFSGVNSFSLMAIPFFMLSGELMEAGGISERLIEIAKAFLGHITGGIIGILKGNREIRLFHRSRVRVRDIIADIQIQQRLF